MMILIDRSHFLLQEIVDLQAQWTNFQEFDHVNFRMLIYNEVNLSFNQK